MLGGILVTVGSMCYCCHKNARKRQTIIRGSRNLQDVGGSSGYLWRTTSSGLPIYSEDEQAKLI